MCTSKPCPHTCTRGMSNPCTHIRTCGMSNPCTHICTHAHPYIFPPCTHPSRIHQQGLYPEGVLSAEAPQDQAPLTGAAVTLLPALGLSSEAEDEGNRPSCSESLPSRAPLSLHLLRPVASSLSSFLDSLIHPRTRRLRTQAGSSISTKNTPALALWGCFSFSASELSPCQTPPYVHTQHINIDTHVSTCVHTHLHTPAYRHTCAHTVVTHKHIPSTHTPHVYPPVPPSPEGWCVWGRV